MAICLTGSALADDPGLQQRHWLQGVAFRYEGLRADIQADLKTAETQAAMAKNLMSRAQAAQNAAAQDLANRSLATAEKTKAMSLERLRRVEAELQQVLELLALPGARLAKINSLATELRGEVKIRRAGSDQWANADGAALQTLAAGDVIATGKGRLALNLHNETGLDSRLQLAADTTLRVQASEPGQDESLELFVEKGSLYWREKTTGPAGEALKKRRVSCLEKFLKSLPKNGYTNSYKMLQACSYSERWRLRGSYTCSVRGTEFLLIEDGRGFSECVVLEGSVICHSPKLGKVVVVEKGQSVTMNPEGEFSPVKHLDAKESKGWWNE